MVEVCETIIHTMKIANAVEEPQISYFEMTTGQEIILRKLNRNWYKIEEV